MFHRHKTPNASDDDGDSSKVLRKKKTSKTPIAEMPSKIFQRMMRTPSRQSLSPTQDHPLSSSPPTQLPPVPTLPPIFLSSPTSVFGEPVTSPTQLLPPTDWSDGHLRQTRSIDSFRHRSPSVPFPPTDLPSRQTNDPSTSDSRSHGVQPHRTVSTMTFPAPTTTSITGAGWDPSVQARLRELPRGEIDSGGEFGSGPDQGETETEWDTDAGANAYSRFGHRWTSFGSTSGSGGGAGGGGISSDADIYSSGEESRASRVGQSGPSPPPKQNRASGAGFLPTPRTQTFSTASSASSVGYARARVASAAAAPPVPSLPSEYTKPGTSRHTKSNLQLDMSNEDLNDPTGLHPPVDPNAPLLIAIVGSTKCGKSEFAWKGMKAWGMDPEESRYDFNGIQVRTRHANLATRPTSTFPNPSSAASSSSKPGKHHFRVQVLEVDSADLLQGVPANMSLDELDPSPTDGLWAWPVTLPKIDGVMVCYDVNNPESFEGIPQLCAAYYALQVPVVVVQCKSDLEKRVPSDHVASRASWYSIGLVEVSTRTEAGKKKAKDSFNWLMKAIWRARKGDTPPPGSTWRNPASPAVLLEIPWELEEVLEDNLPLSPHQSNNSHNGTAAVSIPLTTSISAPIPSSRIKSRPRLPSPDTPSVPRISSTHHIASRTTHSPSYIRAAPSTSPPTPALPASPTSPTRAKSTPDLLAAAAKQSSASALTDAPPSMHFASMDPSPTTSGWKESIGSNRKRQTIETAAALRASMSLSDLKAPPPEASPHPPPSPPEPQPVITFEMFLPKQTLRPPHPMQFSTFDSIVDRIHYLKTTQDDEEMINTFFCSFRRFATPRKVIVALHRRYEALANTQKHAQTATFGQLKIGHLIENWMIEYPYDFVTPGAAPALTALLRDMAKKPATLSYACDLMARLKDYQQNRTLVDLDTNWAIKKDPDDDGYAADAEERDGATTPRKDKGKKKRSRSRARTPKPMGMQFSIHTRTTTTIEGESISPIGNGNRDDVPHPHHHSSPDGRASSLYATVEHPTIASRLTASPPPSSYARASLGVSSIVAGSSKAAKRVRSTSSFGLLGLGGLGNLISPSKTKTFGKSSTPTQSQADIDKEILEELNRAVEVFLKQDSLEIAQEITREQARLFLQIKPRDWMASFLRKKPEGADDDYKFPPTAVDHFNAHVNRSGDWARSMVLAPESLTQRAKVAMKLIIVGKHLRNQNNYAAAHAMMSGVRDCLHQLDKLKERVEKGSDDYKTFRSNEMLFSASGGFSRYRLALKHSNGPVIMDLSVHSPDFARMNIVPDYNEDEPDKLNWGKFITVGKTIASVTVYQKRFEAYNSHDFEPRPVISALLNDPAVMSDKMSDDRMQKLDVLDSGPKHRTLKELFNIQIGHSSTNERDLILSD